MAIDKQHFEIAFNSGTDESSSDDVNAATVARLVNGEYLKDGAITKRKGFESRGTLGVGMVAGSLIGNGKNLAVLTRNALVGVTDTGGIDATPYKRLQDCARLNSRVIAQLADGAKLVSCSVAAASGYLMVVGWRHESDDRVLMSMVELSTGSVVARVMSPAGYTNPKVVHQSGRFVVYAHNGSNIVTFVFTISAPTGGYLLTGPGIAAGTAYDVVVDPTDATKALMAYKNGSSQLCVSQMTQLTGAAVTTFTDTGITNAINVSICRNTSNSLVHVAYTLAAGGYSLASYASNLSARSLGPTAISATTVMEGIGITHLANSSWLAIVAGSDEDRSACSQVTIAHGSISSRVDFLYQELCSKPFSFASGAFATATGPDRAYVILGRMRDELDSGASGIAPGIPSSYVAMLPLGDGLDFEISGPTFANDAVEPVTMVLNAADAMTSHDLVTAYPPPVVYDSTSGKWYTVRLEIVENDARNNAGTGPYYKPRANIVVVELSQDPTPEPRAVLGETAYVGGGLLRSYDGHTLGEAVVLQAPIAPRQAADGASPGPAAGTLSYIATLEWTTSAGDVLRSQPSTAYSYVHTSGRVTLSVPIRVPSMMNVDANDAAAAAGWRVKLWRAVGSTYYLAVAQDISSTFTTATMVDTFTDAEVSANETLYTTGGELEVQSTPACTALAAHQGRLFGVSAQDPRQVFCSKVKLEAVGLEFNGTLAFRLDDAPGGVVAIASMDDKLLALTETDTYAVVGEGPSSLGVGAFNPPELVARGLGASNAESVVVTPIGALVVSSSGLRFLGRDMGVSDIFLADDEFSSGDVLRGMYVGERKQAWFLLDDRIVVLDHSRPTQATLWRASVYTLEAPFTLLDMALVNGVPYVLAYDADNEGGHTAAPRYILYRQTTGNYDDNGVFVPMTVTSGFFRPDGLLGEARFWRVHVYGSMAATAPTNVSVTVDLQDGGLGAQTSAVSTQQFDFPNAAVMPRAGTRTSFRERLKRQRGFAARATIAQTEASQANTQGLVLYGVGWDVGVKGRSPKSPATSGAT